MPSASGCTLRASMGPRHRRRGWAGPQRPRVRESVRFNGAASSKTRMADTDPDDAVRRLIASMGPRHRRRGWRLTFDESAAACRGFNGAASSKTRMASLTTRESTGSARFNGAASSKTRMGTFPDLGIETISGLQWGRVIEDADGRVRDDLRRLVADASMGPRHRRRGWDRRARCHGPAGMASMGPRHRRRGWSCCCNSSDGKSLGALFRAV